ncbi:MAG: tRNA (N6-threonylcarbamoyladenosine(37)-N6)-methyltransferase TrmO [Bdellovibrionaceae bacterium]|nr:tRNA (N6-threonylcarbamoyladenosine(37)-N6)-methyltransferase TrmO [Bdellovibrio sp.]
MKSAEQFTFTAIGFLKSCYPEKFGVPRQPGLVKKAYSELKIRADLQPEISLQGLAGYSHVWLQFIFHLNTSQRFHAKVHPPRLEGETMGLFATRTPHRPNPIGLSLVELVEVKKDTLFFAGADLVEGTPILDVKPYLPHIESVANARNGWLGAVQKDDIEVSFTEKSLIQLQNWMTQSGRFELKEVITEVLKQDPRPTIYKGYETGESPYRNKHAFRLYDGDIHFEFLSATNAEVFDIRF